MARLLQLIAAKPVNQIAFCKRLMSYSLTDGFNFAEGVKSHSIDNEGMINILNPATSEVLCTVPSSGQEEVNRVVKNSKSAHSAWAKLSGFERGKYLQRIGNKITENLESLAELEVLNNGKPIWEARIDIQTCADCFLYYGGVATTITGQHIQLPNDAVGLIKRESLGVIGCIGAWNYPMQTCSWKVAPALACGNTVVYKPSEFTPLTALALAELAAEVGLPPGTFNILQGGGDVGSKLCHHPDIAKISFTGSVPTGKKIMATAAKDLKRVTLELGGKSPLIIFEDCDLDNAVKGALMANFLSQGQVCSNGTRVFVHRSIAKEFKEKLVKATLDLKIGDPMDEDTRVGATISKNHSEKVLGYIDSAVEEGAAILCGGKRVLLPGRLENGYYLSPCILDNCHDEMKCVKEEIFGSVLSLLEFDTEEEVVRRANDTPFGLGGGLFTKDLKRAHAVSDALQCGSVWVNNYNLVPMELPFGGYKMSGFGRENSLEALQYYTQSKAVYIEMHDVEF